MANSKNITVHVATNLLESMVKNKKPTRAEVNDIINTLTYYAMPLRKDDVAMTYELPAVFELEYMYRDNINKYIMPALSLALESVDVKYCGEKFVTFRGNEKGAQPVRTDVVLTFKELEIADRASIYGDDVGMSFGNWQQGQSDKQFTTATTDTEGSS